MNSTDNKEQSRFERRRFQLFFGAHAAKKKPNNGCSFFHRLFSQFDLFHRLDIYFSSIYQMVSEMKIQAALVIRGLNIYGFEYPRIVKWAKTADNERKFVFL
jgi:hypothetical protein